MDSVNSGMSLQSSSGAEEECDSQFTTTTTTTNIYQLHQPPPPPFNHHIYNNTSNQINNLNPNPTFFSPTPQHQQLDSVFWSKNNLLHEPITSMPTTLNPNPHLVNPTKNPKKRSRASRKAPTTVLTTDTSNFRALVQEFTGIPAPPFITTSSSSPLFPPRLSTTSFDLFGRPSFLPSSSSMNMRFVNNNNNNNNQVLLFDNNPLFPQLMFQSSSSSSTSSLLENYSSMQQNNFHQDDPKTIIQNVFNDDHVIGQQQKQILEIPTSNNVDDHQVASSGNIWDGKNRKEESSAGVKGDQGFIEPWICSSD